METVAHEMTLAVVIARAYEHVVRRRAAMIELNGEGPELQSVTVVDPQGYVLVLLGENDPGWDEMEAAWKAAAAQCPEPPGPAVMRLRVDGSWTMGPATGTPEPTCIPTPLANIVRDPVGQSALAPDPGSPRRAATSEPPERNGVARGTG